MTNTNITIAAVDFITLLAGRSAQAGQSGFLLRSRPVFCAAAKLGEERERGYSRETLIGYQ
jgi:hypothetical protein